MSKGIIYVMNTCVDGLVKIGKTGIDNFEQRMTQLENNGYRRISVLTREFAIEVEDYDAKEKLIHELFSKSRVGNSELFSVDINLVKQLMASFEGKVVYPKDEKKEEIFEQATEVVEVKRGIIPEGIYTMKTKIKGTKSYCEATLVVTDDKQLILKKGAIIGPMNQKSPMAWMKVRTSLNIIDDVLQEDLICTSASMAAAIVVGHNYNGWKAWRNSNGEYIDVYRQALVEENEE